MSMISHLVSPLSKGLFHRAVIESGPLGLPFNQYGEDNKYYRQFVQNAGCMNAARVAECLRSQKLETLIEIQENINIIPLPKPIHYILPWMPTYGNDEIPFHPYLAYKNGNIESKVPLLAGSNKEDGRPFIYAAVDFELDWAAYDLTLLALFGTHVSPGQEELGNESRGHPIESTRSACRLPKDWPDASLTFFVFSSLSQTLRIAEMYTNYSNPEDNRIAMQQLATDYLFTCSARFVAQSYKRAGLPVFTYNFGYGFTSTFWGPYTFCCEGHSCHGVELPFVFDLFAEPSMSYMKRTKTDEYVGRNTQAYWIDFVKAKEINGSSVLSSGAAAGAPWTQFDDQMQQWINITEDAPSMTGDFKKAECDMWDQIGYMLWQ